MGNRNQVIRKNFQQLSIDAFGNITSVDSMKILDSSRIGANDPFWKSKVARGASATNYLYATKKWMEFLPSTLTAYYNSGSLKGSRIYTETHHPFPEDIFNNVDGDALIAATNEAAMRVLRQIQKQTSSFSGLPMLGELREAAHMIRKPAEALADLLNEAAKKKEKRKKSGKRNLVNTAGDSWLEGVFGWAPLVSDINGIAEALLARSGNSGIKRIVGVGKRDWSSSSIHSGGSNNYHQYYYNREFIGTVEVKFTAGISTLIERSNNALERVVEQGSMNWNDVIPAAWELLPWSFLADYFGNIGDVLTAASISRSSVAWSAKTVRSHQEVRTTGISFENVGKTSVDSGGWGFGHSRSYLSIVERGAASIPNPELRFELPGRKGQWLNVAALLAGRL